MNKKLFFFPLMKEKEEKKIYDHEVSNEIIFCSCYAAELGLLALSSNDLRQSCGIAARAAFISNC